MAEENLTSILKVLEDVRDEAIQEASLSHEKEMEATKAALTMIMTSEILKRNQVGFQIDDSYLLSRFCSRENTKKPRETVSI